MWKDPAKTKAYRAIYNREYYKKNKEKINKQNSEYHNKNKDVLNEKSRKWYHENIEKVKEYRKRNRERISKQGKEWRLRNIEHRKAYHKWFERTPERIAYRKRWTRENPKSRCSSYPLELELAMNAVRVRDNNICQWQGCGLNHRQAPIHVHHIFPRSEYPELELVEQYMICYCANHHGYWHRMRGDPCHTILNNSKFEVLEI